MILFFVQEYYSSFGGGGGGAVELMEPAKFLKFVRDAGLLEPGEAGAALNPWDADLVFLKAAASSAHARAGGGRAGSPARRRHRPSGEGGASGGGGDADAKRLDFTAFVGALGCLAGIKYRALLPPPPARGRDGTDEGSAMLLQARRQKTKIENHRSLRVRSLDPRVAIAASLHQLPPLPPPSPPISPAPLLLIVFS